MAYFSYDTDTGELIQISDYEITEVSGHDNYAISIHNLPKVALDTEYEWDIAARDFKIKSRVRLSKLQFLQRFTTAERIAIRERAKIDPIVFDAMDLLNMAEYVDVSRTDTQELVGYLVLVGVLDSNRLSVILAQ
jgi:hypothetical protein